MTNRKEKNIIERNRIYNEEIKRQQKNLDPNKAYILDPFVGYIERKVK